MRAVGCGNVMSIKNVLFFAEAVTLAHVARPYVLGKALDPARYRVVFARDPFSPVAPDEAFQKLMAADILFTPIEEIARAAALFGILGLLRKWFSGGMGRARLS